MSDPPNKVDGFTVIRLETSADPAKDSAWLAAQAKQHPKDDFDREFLLLPVGRADSYPVFGDYQRQHHESELLRYNYHLKYIYRGWDFGKVHPCVEFIQPDGQKLNVIYEIYGTNIMLEQFAERVLADSGLYFPGAMFVDWGDASGVNEKDDGRPSIRVLADKGIRLRIRRQPVEDGVREISKTLIAWTEGRPVLQINPKTCPHLVEAMRGGYRRNPAGIIVKDGKNDHPADAFRYGFSGIQFMIGTAVVRSTPRKHPKPNRPLSDCEAFSKGGHI